MHHAAAGNRHAMWSAARRWRPLRDSFPRWPGR
jgi:hypothetical protein